MAVGTSSTLPAGELTVGTISSQGQPGSTSTHCQPWDQWGCSKPQLIVCFAGPSPGHTVTGEVLPKQTQMWSLECKMFLSGQHLQKEGGRSRTAEEKKSSCSAGLSSARPTWQKALEPMVHQIHPCQAGGVRPLDPHFPGPPDVGHPEEGMAWGGTVPSSRGRFWGSEELGAACWQPCRWTASKSCLEGRPKEWRRTPIHFKWWDTSSPRFEAWNFNRK